MAQEELIKFYDPDFERIIEKAGRAHHKVRIVYRDAKGNRSARTVDPYEIKDGGMFAFDPRKDSIRFFKLNRIVRVAETRSVFIPKKEWPVKF